RLGSRVHGAQPQRRRAGRRHSNGSVGRRSASRPRSTGARARCILPLGAARPTNTGRHPRCREPEKVTRMAHSSTGVKEADAKSYDATAAEFAVLTENYSTKVASRMLDLAGVKAGDRLLDIGTGTGLLARMAAERRADAVGIDHSAGMLAQAQASADEAGVGNRTQFLQMDAEALKFEDESFEDTVSLFVLRHLPNPAAAVREMHRTLKPGGRLIVSIGARPNPFSTT